MGENEDEAGEESTKAAPRKRLADKDLRRVLDTKRCRVSVTSTMTSTMTSPPKPPPVVSVSSSDDKIQSYDSPASPPPCYFSPASPPYIPLTQKNAEEEEEEVILVGQSPSSSASSSSSASYSSPLPAKLMEPAACVILIEEWATNLIMSTGYKTGMSVEEVTKGVCRTISHAMSTPRWQTYFKGQINVFNSWEDIM